MCRFINADRLIDDGAGLQGANLFQYCGNNPINNFDPTWQFVLTISACIAIGSVVIGSLAFGHTAATSYKYTGSVDWLGATINGVGWGLTAYTMGMSAYGIYCNYSYSTGKTPVTSVNIGNSSVPAYPPNDGFNATSRSSTLSPGSTLQRSGGIQGKFVAPVNTPVEKLSLPPDKINAPITYYTVLKPIQVQAGTAMPWFNQPGGGTQFLLPDSIANLQKTDILRFFQNEVTRCYLKNHGNIKQQALIETARFLALMFLILNGAILGKRRQLSIRYIIKNIPLMCLV